MTQKKSIAYRTLIFDCDGVLLNSNKVKTDAFYQAALPFGETAAQALVDYHVQNGGVSRYQKFEHFLRNIAPHDANGPSLDELLERFANEVRAGLLECEIAEGLSELRKATPNMKWLVVSGGDQSELREVFKIRNLDTLFDGGIFGSPSTKFEIISDQFSKDKIPGPALFLGDSQLDSEVASHFGLDFVFIFKWTEFLGWNAYFSNNEIPSYSVVKDAMASFLPPSC